MAVAKSTQTRNAAHAPSNITMHPYIHTVSSCKPNLWRSIAATYVEMHSYVGQCIVLQSLCVCAFYHCHFYNLHEIITS